MDGHHLTKCQHRVPSMYCRLKEKQRGCMQQGRPNGGVVSARVGRAALQWLCSRICVFRRGQMGSHPSGEFLTQTICMQIRGSRLEIRTSVASHKEEKKQKLKTEEVNNDRRSLTEHLCISGFSMVPSIWPGEAWPLQTHTPTLTQVPLPALGQPSRVLQPRDFPAHILTKLPFRRGLLKCCFHVVLLPRNGQIQGGLNWLCNLKRPSGALSKANPRQITSSWATASSPLLFCITTASVAPFTQQSIIAGLGGRSWQGLSVSKCLSSRTAAEGRI